MKKYLFLICACYTLCFPASISAQGNSHYEHILTYSESNQEKLVALDSLVSKNKRVNVDEFIKYSLEYIDLAKEMDSIEAAARKFVGVSYSLMTRNNERRQVITIADGLLARKYQIQDSFLLGSIHLKRGGANVKLDLDQAVIDYQNAIDNYGRKDSVYIADAYLFSGQAYSNMGKFVPAGESYKKSYEYFEYLKDYEYMYYAQQGITTMYSMNGFYDKAKEEREENIKKIKELGLDHYLALTHYNQALDYYKLGDKTNYITSLLKANAAINKDVERRLSSSTTLTIYAELVDFYANEGATTKASEFLSKIKKLYDPSKENLIASSSYERAMAIYNYANADYNSALSHALKRLQNAKKLNHEEDIIGTYELLAKIYVAKEDYKKGFESKEKYIALKDSTYNRTSAHTLAYYQTLYETEKQENELIAKSTNIQLLEKDNESAKKRFMYIAFALGSLFGMILLYRNRRQLNNKRVLQEKFSQELLVSQEEERKRISKDLHDGLGQRLLLIKNKMVKTNDQESMGLVETAIEEVRAISRNLHPFQLQEFGITKAIEMTINQIDDNTTLFISSEIDNIDNLFSKKQEVNLYRIVQESLSNILKHAQAEAGKVVIKRENQGVKITIRDNGIGFDFTEKYHNARSLGLKTLLERTKFLKGQMKIHSKKNNGTLLEFQFPTV